MENPRPEKVAVVDEVRERLSSADAVLVTEYRGLNVTAMGALRRSLSDAGGDYKIYKNTLVRFAVRDLGLTEAEELLTGPTAIAFVATRPDGGAGDPVTVAKALRDFARTNPNLVLKGGLLGQKVLSAEDVRALADVAPREVLLARLAGGFAAPMQQFASLLAAVPRNFAYGLKALIDQRGGDDAIAAEAPAATPDTTTDDTAADATPAAEPTDGASADTTDDAAADAAPAAETTDGASAESTDGASADTTDDAAADAAPAAETTDGATADTTQES